MSDLQSMMINNYGGNTVARGRAKGRTWTRGERIYDYITINTGIQFHTHSIRCHSMVIGIDPAERCETRSDRNRFWTVWIERTPYVHWVTKARCIYVLSISVDKGVLLRDILNSTQSTIVFELFKPYALAGISLYNIGIVWYCVWLCCGELVKQHLLIARNTTIYTQFTCIYHVQKRLAVRYAYTHIHGYIVWKSCRMRIRTL